MIAVTAILLGGMELLSGWLLSTRVGTAPQSRALDAADAVALSIELLPLNPVPLEPDPDLLWRNAAGASRTQPVDPRPLGQQPTWTVSINSEGFRGPERMEHADPMYRILCIGDSVTFGFNVDQPDSYPQRLQRLLRRELGDHVEVINAAVPGWSWLQGLRFLELYGAALDPDLVVVAHGTNDRFWRAGTTDQEHLARLQVPHLRAAQRAADFLTRFDTFRLIRAAFPAVPSQSPECAAQVERDGICRRLSLSDIEHAVGQIHRHADSLSSDLLVLNLDFFETDAVRAVRRAVERNGIRFIDLVARFRAKVASDERRRATAAGLAPADLSTSRRQPPERVPEQKRLVFRVEVGEEAPIRVAGADFPPAGFRFDASLRDDGTDGDEQAGDGVYSATVLVPSDVVSLQFLFFRDDQPEFEALPPLPSTSRGRLLRFTSGSLTPIYSLGTRLLMAERAHPNARGQAVIANSVRRALVTMPSFDSFRKRIVAASR